MTTLSLQDLLPTDDDVAAYRRDGFYVAHAVLPAELLDTAERGMERFYTGNHDAPFPGTSPYDHYDWKPEHGNTIRKNDYTSHQVQEIAALTRYPVIGAIAAKLAGATEIRLWHDQLLYKPAGLDTGAGNVGWHTDRQYWQTCTSEEMLTGWVPFHDCDATIGGVTFVKGSHLWEQGRLDFWNTDLDALESRFASEGRPVEKVTPVLPRGSMTFHHNKTIHGSGPNLSSSPRRSVAIHLQPGDNRYQEAPPLADGTPQDHRNDSMVRLVDGRPDYTDPGICPQIWPAQG